ncbi:MAG TPA: dicarboxylate/amino acid:cation symporter [Polyangiaceae bacterium]|nr:dicarboxylate/amino acid:cation symporter [Polyangiaceae bacterium]
MKKLKLHHWILLAMVLGAGIGLPLNLAGERGAVDPEVVREVAEVGEAIGGLFLSLLKMIVVPLIITSLITGVTGIGDPRKLGRLGARTFAYYMATSAMAITVGIVVVNLVQPGAGMGLGVLTLDTSASASVHDAETSLGVILWNQLTGMIPHNPVQATAEGDMLPVIFFTLLFGLFVSITGGEHAERLRGLFESGFAVMMRMTMAIISLAPIGVFGFMLYAAAGSGLSAFAALGKYMLAVALGLAVHAFLVLPALLTVVGRRSPWAFAKAMSPALLTAFSTASSNATLPLTMTSIEERAGVSNRVGSFVLPLGATVNMDGTALYEAVAVLFIAQAHGMHLSLSAQIVVAVTALLASIGAAGIPHAGTVMMVVVLDAVGLPADAVGLILAVDRVLDMCRTTVNVWSDSVAAAVVARFEDGADGEGFASSATA